jgi:hypothetical protein
MAAAGDACHALLSLYVAGEFGKGFEQGARQLRSPRLAREAGEAAQRLSLRG